jgi:hypothetical protein
VLHEFCHDFPLLLVLITTANIMCCLWIIRPLHTELCSRQDQCAVLLADVAVYIKHLTIPYVKDGRRPTCCPKAGKVMLLQNKVRA